MGLASPWSTYYYRSKIQQIHRCRHLGTMLQNCFYFHVEVLCVVHPRQRKLCISQIPSPDKDDSFCWGNLCFQQPNCSASETGQPWFSFGPHLCKDKPHCKVQKLFFSLLSFCRQAANNNAPAVQKAPEVKSSCALLLSDFYLGGNYHLHQSQVHSSDTVIVIIFWKMNIMKKHNNLVLLI